MGMNAKAVYALLNAWPCICCSVSAGAFARVLRAELDGRVVALKALLPQWCDPEDARCRAYQQHFIKEGRFLAKTKHT